jgi:two-component system, OmpR family, sensor histidine kinase CiaH
MSQSHVQTVRAASIRVALATTAVVAAVYLAIAAAVVAITTQNLTSQIDASLRDTLAHISRGPGGPSGPGGSGGEGGFRPPDKGPFNTPAIVWTIQPDGTVFSSDATAVLPAAYYGATSPVTVGIGDATVRIAGGTAPDGDHVVVGQTLDAVGQAQSTIVLAELLIGPILLIIVFLGAVAIGRRVAAPIEQARQRQMEFTADASHELRTPLSVIEAHTSLALAQDRSEAWYRSAFERIDREGRRMRRLVDDLLWLARFDVTQGQPNAEPIDVGVLAAQTTDRFGIVAQTRQLALNVEASPGSNVVTVPPEWLDRLLGVLLDNACKYSPQGGSIRVSVAPEGARIRLSVDDSGPGIPEEERVRIFDRFHRASNAAGGAGLGLAIADAIVRATNGRWRIATSPAGGASMSVTWPRAFSGRGEAADAREREPLERGPEVREHEAHEPGSRPTTA